MFKYLVLLLFLLGCDFVRVIECDKDDRAGDEICQQKCEECAVQCFKVLKKLTVIDEKTGDLSYRCEADPFQEKYFLRIL